MKANKNYKTGEIQDLTSSLNARIHYAKEALKEQIRESVRRGNLLKSLTPTQIDELETNGADIKTDLQGYIDIAKTFQSYSTYTEEQWDEVQSKYFDGISLMMEIDWEDAGKTKKKRKKIDQLLKDDGFFALCFFGFQEMLKMKEEETGKSAL